MTPEQNLDRLGITLPEAPPPVAAYLPWIQTGQLVITSGQLPWRDGEIAYAGKLGADLTDEEGYQAARQCAINAIAQLQGRGRRTLPRRANRSPGGLRTCGARLPRPSARTQWSF